MKTLQKIWFFLSKAGFSLFLLTIMFVGAISLVSITQKGKIYYGNRCLGNINEKALKYLNQDEIISYDYELKCNTLYLDLVLQDDIKEESVKGLLVRISSYFTSINYKIDTHITLKGFDYMILATIVNEEITMSTTIY